MTLQEDARNSASRGHSATRRRCTQAPSTLACRRCDVDVTGMLQLGGVHMAHGVDTGEGRQCFLSRQRLLSFCPRPARVQGHVLRGASCCRCCCCCCEATRSLITHTPRREMGADGGCPWRGVSAARVCRVSAARVGQGSVVASRAHAHISSPQVSMPCRMRAWTRNASARAGMHERWSVRRYARARVTVEPEDARVAAIRACFTRTRGGGTPDVQTHWTCRAQGLVRHARHPSTSAAHSPMRARAGRSGEQHMRAHEHAQAQGPEGDTVRRRARTGSCR